MGDVPGLHSQPVPVVPDPEQSQETLEDVIPRKEIIRRFYKRSDFEGCKQLLFHMSAFALSTTVAWYTRTSFFWFLGLAFHSFMISFLFHGLHETVHETAFNSKLGNFLTRNIYGFLCFRPPSHYYYYHWAHHRFTGNPNKDPELFNTYTDIHITSFKTYFLYLKGFMFWVDRFSTILRHSRGIFYTGNFEYFLNSTSAQNKCRKEARLFLLSYFIIFTLSICDTKLGSFALYFWILPSLLGQIHLRFYLLAEHRGCLESNNIYNNTRTTSRFGWYRKLAWNMPYHAEHHAWPGVPFYLLGKVHELTKHVKSGCEPTGANGYIHVNYEIARKL